MHHKSLETVLNSVLKILLVMNISSLLGCRVTQYHSIWSACHLISYWALQISRWLHLDDVFFIFVCILPFTCSPVENVSRRKSRRLLRHVSSSHSPQKFNKDFFRTSGSFILYILKADVTSDFKDTMSAEVPSSHRGMECFAGAHCSPFCSSVEVFTRST